MRVYKKSKDIQKHIKTDPNLKSLMMTRASRPLESRISSSVTRKARGIQETEGRKRRKEKVSSWKWICWPLERRRAYYMGANEGCFLKMEKRVRVTKAKPMLMAAEANRLWGFIFYFYFYFFSLSQSHTHWKRSLAL